MSKIVSAKLKEDLFGAGRYYLISKTKHQPVFKVGDWVMCKDGSSFCIDDGWVYRHKCRDIISAKGCPESECFSPNFFRLGPPEPPAEVLAAYKKDGKPYPLKVVDFRPPKKHDIVWAAHGLVIDDYTVDCKDGPRYILAPVEQPAEKTVERSCDNCGNLRTISDSCVAPRLCRGDPPSEWIPIADPNLEQRVERLEKDVRALKWGGEA